jgi:hypothetical protein
MFGNPLNRWLDFVALPLALAERSSRRWVRVVGCLAVFPWFLMMACLGPVVLGFGVIFLIGMLLEEV